MIKNESFLQGEGVSGDEGSIDVTVSAQGVVLGFPTGDGDNSEWFYRCLEPDRVRYLGQAIIAAGDALEELQAKEGQ